MCVQEDVTKAICHHHGCGQVQIWSEGDKTHLGADMMSEFPLLAASCLKFESRIHAVLGIMICLC